MRQWAWLLVLVGSLADAHPLAPALLDIHETGATTYVATLRTSVVAVRGTEVLPEWPDACDVEETQAPALAGPDAVQRAWSLRCVDGLFGRRIGISGLDQSGIDMIVRAEGQDGAVAQALVDVASPDLVLVRPQPEASVFVRYLNLGCAHLLSGPDHLLLIVGLLLIVRGVRRLFWTLTAFTLGHSLTLSAATLGFVHVPSALMELAIAASLLVLAVQASGPIAAGDRRAMRRPWVYALIFGLVHGLGFAGALSEIGLPQREIPRALLSFNLGIELAQLMVVAAVLGAGMAARRLMRARPVSVLPGYAALRGVAVYVIGSMAVFWCLERGVAVIG